LPRFVETTGKVTACADLRQSDTRGCFQYSIFVITPTRNVPVTVKTTGMFHARGDLPAVCERGLLVSLVGAGNRCEDSRNQQGQ
jgi:hypothetical protein